MEQMSLVGCARIIVEKMVKLSKDESVAIITDYNYPREISNAIFECSLASGSESAKILTSPPTGGFISGDIPKIVKATADSADVIFACTSTSFPIPVRTDLVKKGKKFILMHHLSKDLFLRTVPIDLDLLQRRAEKLVKILPKTDEVHMTSLGGSDIKFSLKDCKIGLIYDGICNPGEFDAVPSGVVDALPVPDTGNGILVIDGSLSGYGLIRTPMRITVKDGKLIKIEGGPEANWLDKAMKKSLSEGDENANHWAEFLIGLNPNANLTRQGSLLEDERQLCGINIGWGRDTHFGGKFESKFHGDGHLIDATVTLDGIKYIDNGKPTKELFG